MINLANNNKEVSIDNKVSFCGLEYLLTDNEAKGLMQYLDKVVKSRGNVKVNSNTLVFAEDLEEPKKAYKPSKRGTFDPHTANAKDVEVKYEILKNPTGNGVLLKFDGTFGRDIYQYISHAFYLDGYKYSKSLHGWAFPSMRKAQEYAKKYSKVTGEERRKVWIANAENTGEFANK
jgi:hypothetical protein